MQIAALRPSTAPSPVTAGYPPARTVFERYGTTIMSLAGIGSCGWSEVEPTSIAVRANNSELAYLVDQVLVDSIDGVHLDIVSTGGDSDVPADSWVRNGGNIARFATSLLGVVGYTTALGGYSFIADTPERADLLRSVISPTINGQPTHVLTQDDMP